MCVRDFVIFLPILPVSFHSVCDNCFLLLSFSTLTLKLCRCFFGMLFPLPLSPQWSTKALPLAAVLTENDEYNFAVFTVQNTNLKDRNYILS